MTKEAKEKLKNAVTNLFYGPVDLVIEDLIEFINIDNNTNLPSTLESDKDYDELMTAIDTID